MYVLLLTNLYYYYITYDIHVYIYFWADMYIYNFEISSSKSH